MKEFEHFKICHFCTAIIQNELHFSFEVPRAHEVADVCAVCMGEVINNLSTEDAKCFIEQRGIWEECGDEEEEDQEEAFLLQHELDDIDPYNI